MCLKHFRSRMFSMSHSLTIKLTSLRQNQIWRTSISTNDSFDIFSPHPARDKPALSYLATLPFVSQVSLRYPFPRDIPFPKEAHSISEGNSKLLQHLSRPSTALLQSRKEIPHWKVQPLSSSTVRHCGSPGVQKYFRNHLTNTLTGHRKMLLQIQKSFS